MFSSLKYYLKSIPTIIRGIKKHYKVIYLIFSNPQKIHQIELRDGSTFYLRTLMDFWILKETCLDRQYETFGIPIEDGWTVVDVGGGWGDFAISVGRRNPTSRVIAFEPYSPSIALFELNIDLNRVSNVRLARAAIGKASGRVKLSTQKKEALQLSTVDSSTLQGLEVNSLTLEDAFISQQIDQCDFLKMDCEGGEYEILFSAGPTILKNIHRICMEIHDGVTQYSHQDMIQFLEGCGYRVRYEVNPVHNYLGMLYAERKFHPMR